MRASRFSMSRSGSTCVRIGRISILCYFPSCVDTTFYRRIKKQMSKKTQTNSSHLKENKRSFVQRQRWMNLGLEPRFSLHLITCSKMEGSSYSKFIVPEPNNPISQGIQHMWKYWVAAFTEKWGNLCSRFWVFIYSFWDWWMLVVY